MTQQGLHFQTNFLIRFKSNFMNSKSNTVKEINNINSSIATGLQILRQNHIEFVKAGNTICDAAIIHGYQSGLRLFDGDRLLCEGSWTMAGKKNILALKDLIRASAELSGKVTFDNGEISGKQGLLDAFYELWYFHCPDFGIKDIIDVFMVSMTYTPLKLRLTLPKETASLYINLLRAMTLIFTGFREVVAAEDLAHYSPIFEVLNGQMPKAKLIPTMKGTYEITTKEGTGTYFVNFGYCNTKAIMGEYISGHRHSPDMIEHDFTIKEILFMKAA
jgi:hypothetical protein